MTSESPWTTRARNRRTGLIDSAVLSVGVALLRTRPELPVVAGVRLVWPLGILLLFLYVSIGIRLRHLRQIGGRTCLAGSSLS